MAGAMAQSWFRQMMAVDRKHLPMNHWIMDFKPRLQVQAHRHTPYFKSQTSRYPHAVVVASLYLEHPATGKICRLSYALVTRH